MKKSFTKKEGFIFINEENYIKAKREMNKKDDYFTQDDLKNLMQFLMQRQEKTIKNEEKI